VSFTLLLLGAGVKKTFFIFCVFFVQLAWASVPEPSFIVYGQVLSSGAQVKQSGMVVTGKYGNTSLAESTLSSANNFEYVLEIPLESSIGNRDTYRARVGDVISLQIAGATVANIQISDRGVSFLQNVNLPESFDSDGDGIYDSLEIADGRNPNDPNDPVKFGNLDLDGDGITNGLEFLNNTYDPHADFDGDGFSNEHEYTLGKNPTLATNMPKQVPDAGKYSALHVHTDSFSYLQNQQGSALTWDEQVDGAPLMLLPIFWDADLTLDMLVATDQGKVFLLKANLQGQYASPVLLNLFSLPVGGKTRIGLTDIDGINAKELWVHSDVTNKLYLYQRQPSGVPYGSDLWFDVSLPQISGDLLLADINADGAMDVLATGVDVSDAATVVDTLVQINGSWDGYTLGFNAPVQLAKQTYINNSVIQLLPNIEEVGFDKKPDLMIKGTDHKFVINLSLNGFNNAALANNLIQKVVTQASANPTASLFAQGAQLNTGAVSTPFVMANFDSDSASSTDLLQYMGNTGSNTYQFRITKGVTNTKESDGDGIFDYKDVDANNRDKPLPNGHIDYDQDGIPYGIDGNHSGQEDADNDGMSDLFEISNGLNPLNAADANGDLDSDGRTNFEESQDGTDPQSKTSVATQDARMITSVKAFEAGTSDMLLLSKELAVSSNNSPSVKIYNLENLSQMRTLQSSDTNGVAKMINAGNLLVMGNVSGQIEIWDATSGIRLAVFDKNNSSVTDLAIDGSSLYSLHADGYFYQYNIETLAYVGNWKIYDGFLTSILARNNVLYIQASNPEKIMFVWNALKQDVIYNINGNAECCEKVVAELSGETLILANSYSGSGIFATNIGNLNSQQVVPDIDISAARSINTSIYVGRKSGVIERYSAVDGSFQGRVAAPYSQVREIDLINGGFISLHADGNVYFWEHK
jgi:hypothetical protein